MTGLLIATGVDGGQPRTVAGVAAMEPGGRMMAEAAWPPKRAFRLPEGEAFQDNCRAAAAYSARHEGHGVLVMLDGRVVFEQYEGGWNGDRPHALASGTKSFCGVAAMLAVQDGLLTLDELVSDTITEWKGDARKSRITVRQILDLSSGLETGEQTLQPMRRRLTGRDRQAGGGGAAARGADDRNAAALEIPLRAEPGTRFIYGPSNFYVFGELMKRKLEEAGTGDWDVAAYLQRRLLDRLGVRARYNRDRAGNPNLPGGCMVSAREWAKFGEWVRMGGVHGGEQVLRAELMAAMLEPSKNNASYGLTWWLLREGQNPEEELAADMLSEGDDARREAIRERLRQRNRRQATAGPAETLGVGELGVMAAGLGKQRLYVLPKFGLTVVRFGELTGGREYQDAAFLALLLEGAEKIDADAGGGAGQGVPTQRAPASR
ncbi:MAG: serine hydrolase [Phycisphaeraceae bacterium]|nr:serine hydrolase [Phycisphaeraceae bacterium]